MVKHRARLSTSTIEIKHSCGKIVRLNLVYAFHNPICPQCKGALELSLWQKLRARALGAKKPTQPQKSSGSFTTGDLDSLFHASFGGRSAPPSASAEFDALLAMLARSAWTKPGPNTEEFLFKTTLPIIRDEKVVEQTVKDMYEHARRWATGFEIPYHVPRLRIVSVLDAAGMFKSDEHGWTTIEIEKEFFNWPAAVWVILAHEICHHFLYQTGLADRLDSTRNERMTDAAMFICGFGKIAFRLDSDQMTQMAENWTTLEEEAGTPLEARLCLQTCLPLLKESFAIQQFLSRHPGLRSAMPEMNSPQEAVAIMTAEWKLTPEEQSVALKALEDPMSLVRWEQAATMAQQESEMNEQNLNLNEQTQDESEGHERTQSEMAKLCSQSWSSGGFPIQGWQIDLRFGSEENLPWPPKETPELSDQEIQDWLEKILNRFPLDQQVLENWEKVAKEDPENAQESAETQILSHLYPDPL